jgi:hypothetical protein
MGALSRHPDSPLVVADWQPDVAQLLDENHLIATSERPGRRLAFAASMSQFLGAQRDAEVCPFYGRYITDLESFCHQLERTIAGPSLRRRIDGIDGVSALLRYRTSVSGRRAARFRYYVWHDADVLLRSDRALFGRLADAMAGVAAEAEYVSDDLLLIHRAVYVGGRDLVEYFDDEEGQFRSWWKDDFGEPFWKVVTGLDAPSCVTCDIDPLDQ